MKMDTVMYLAFLIYIVNSVVVVDSIVDLDFTKCIIENHALFIKGIENLVKSSDPLEVDKVNATNAEMQCKLKDAKLTGLKDCAVKQLTVNMSNLTFKYNLECKKIKANAKYVLSGQISDILVEGNGNVTVITGNYDLKFYGYFEKNVGEDKKEYVHIKKYDLDFDAKENLAFNFTNLYGGDKYKSEDLHRFINENWRFMDKELRAPVLSGFMDVFINNLNDFLKVMPVEKLFPASCRIQN